MIYDILILGAGWTSTFLIPLLQDSKKKYAATSTTGRDSTIRFKFDATKSSDQFKILPTAHYVLITFPLTGPHESEILINGYLDTHKDDSLVTTTTTTTTTTARPTKPRFIQLGSTGIWQFPEQHDLWITRHSDYDRKNSRAQAEDQLKSLGGVILNLSGLWGGPERRPKNFVDRLFKSKETVKNKGSLHMIHGRDVARAVIAVMQDWPGASRWMLTDGFVYDWWSLLAGWGSSSSAKKETGGKGGEAADDGGVEGDHKGDVVKWVWECMEEQEVRALPRSMESLGRCYDSREFWRTFKLEPVRARI